ncbi:unnamed protein product [Porites lobata]|uniref:Uncharacterized protein n=1 Tax=Porites lobata TaxID=104759 RepID=A0ABN8P7J1_9CNID|nr:unnamed protein product [Porites lobata]
MGNAWSSLKEKRKEKKELKRREKTYRILTASAERERISKRKKQLEQEIELIERKIYLEKMMHIARKRNSRPQVRRVIARPSQGSNPSTKQTHLAEVYSRVPSAKSPVLGGFHSKNGPQAQCTTCSYRLYLKDATKGPVDL